MVDILDVAHSYSHSELSKMTRKKTHHKRRNQKQYSLPQSYRFGLQFDVRKPTQKHNYKATGGSGKKHKGIKRLQTAEFRSNQDEIKNQLNEMQSKLEVLTMRVKEVEERGVKEGKLMARKEAEEKREN